MAAPDKAPRAARHAGLARLTTLMQGLSPREQRAVRLATWVLGLGLLWWVGLAPAIRTLGQAPEKHARLDRELAQMQSLAGQAEVVRSQNATPTPARAVAVRSIEEATRSLGDGAQLNLQGDQASLVLREVPADALARWLQQVRINARVLPVQAQLQRSAGGAQWSGQLILAGPGLGSGS